MHTKLKKYRWGFIPELNTRKFLYLLFIIVLLTACTDFVEVDLPKNQLSSEIVFNNATTAEAALNGVYGEMRTKGLLSGSGLNIFMGLYADELELALSQEGTLQDYYNHTLLPSDSFVQSSWNSAYNQIYSANAIIEGVHNSMSLTTEDKNRFKGEALFIRGYLHLLLVELFGDIPYITSTDYIVNTTVSRLSNELVYNHIITDLSLAIELLPEEDISGEKIRPYAAVAEAVLARAYLYTQQWALAESISERVINKFGGLESDLNGVFLKGSTETIWQFKPNLAGNNTEEGAAFIFVSGPPAGTILTDYLLNAFESGDMRRIHWIESVSNSQGTWHHPFKYKERFPTSTSLEYSIQLRLAEQYLIRAEARAHQGEISDAQEDVNVVRNRAGLGNTEASTLDNLLDVILQERQVELFTEKGHRWFDLKRMGKASEVLSPIKLGWRNTDTLLPIPENEILLNPNLLPQNDGY